MADKSPKPSNHNEAGVEYHGQKHPKYTYIDLRDVQTTSRSPNDNTDLNKNVIYSVPNCDNIIEQSQRFQNAQSGDEDGENYTYIDPNDIKKPFAKPCGFINTVTYNANQQTNSALDNHILKTSNQGHCYTYIDVQDKSTDTPEISKPGDNGVHYEPLYNEILGGASVYYETFNQHSKCTDVKGDNATSNTYPMYRAMTGQRSGQKGQDDNLHNDLEIVENGLYNSGNNTTRSPEDDGLTIIEENELYQSGAE